MPQHYDSHNSTRRDSEHSNAKQCIAHTHCSHQQKTMQWRPQHGKHKDGKSCNSTNKWIKACRLIVPFLSKSSRATRRAWIGTAVKQMHSADRLFLSELLPATTKEQRHWPWSSLACRIDLAAFGRLLARGFTLYKSSTLMGCTKSEEYQLWSVEVFCFDRLYKMNTTSAL